MSKLTIVLVLVVLVLGCVAANRRPVCRASKGEILSNPGRCCEYVCANRPHTRPVQVCTNSRTHRCICNPKNHCRNSRTRACQRMIRRG